jgi:cobalt-zinc-cadmium efflux system membrane fusion protein
MDNTRLVTIKPLAYVLLGLVLGAGGCAVLAWLLGWLPASRGARAHGTEALPSAPDLATVELVKDMPNTLKVPDKVREALGIGPAELARKPERAQPLVLPGSTALDPTRIMRVRTRFNAEVMEISQVKEAPGAGPSVTREIRSGDTVRRGDVLGVVWSVDVGSKKSDLVDALVQLRLDEIRLKARLQLWKDGNLPEDTLNQTRRDVVADQNAADRAERTLRTWNIPDGEIQAVRDESEQIYQRQGKRDKEKERLWARSELVAPMDGTLVERNVGKGEYLSDSTVNLFVIADVTRLLVQVNPPEELLPALLRAQKNGKAWRIKTVGLNGEALSPIDEITYIIDPFLHTPVVKSYLDNPEGRPLRAGQYVTASIELPLPDDVVEVPLTALAEDGKQSFLFVQPDPDRPYFTLRRVVVTQRFDRVAYVRSALSSDEQKLSRERKAAGEMEPRPLEERERYLTNGVLELRAALEDRLSRLRQKP